MTKDDILMMARNPYGIYAFTAKDLSKFAELIVQGEREACAKVCEHLWVPEDGDYHWIPDGRGALQSATEAIRARGEK